MKFQGPSGRGATGGPPKLSIVGAVTPNGQSPGTIPLGDASTAAYEGADRVGGGSRGGQFEPGTQPRGVTPMQAQSYVNPQATGQQQQGAPIEGANLPATTGEEMPAVFQMALVQAGKLYQLAKRVPWPVWVVLGLAAGYYIDRSMRKRKKSAAVAE